MNKKKIILALFIVVAAIQLYYPISMINYNEKVLTEGTTYLFKTAPVDPHDPFRGKYVDLNFNDNSCKVGDASFWVRGEKVYAVLTTDEEGFAKIMYLAKEKPKSGLDCIEVKVIYTSKKINEVTVKFPFSRFYMEESKAYDAEVIHRKNQADTTKTTYAVVRIKDGTAILDDVQINGESLRELAKQQKSNP